MYLVNLFGYLVSLFRLVIRLRLKRFIRPLVDRKCPNAASVKSSSSGPLDIPMYPIIISCCLLRCQDYQLERCFPAREQS